MKINYRNKPSGKNKPLHIHSEIYPGIGYVAMPENSRLILQEKKPRKRLKKEYKKINP